MAISRLCGVCDRIINECRLLMESEVAVETEELGANPAQFQFFHHRTGIT
jgi:hypothetical protein